MGTSKTRISGITRSVTNSSRIDPNIGIIVLSPNMQTMIQSVIWTLEAEELLRTPSTNLSGIGTIHHSLLRLKERPISGIISENIVRFRP